MQLLILSNKIDSNLRPEDCKASSMASMEGVQGASLEPTHGHSFGSNIFFTSMILSASIVRHAI